MNFLYKNRGFVALLTNGLIVAFFGLFTRIISAYMGNFTQVFARMILICTLLLPFLLTNKKIWKHIPVHNPLLFFIFIVSFPLYVIFFTFSVNSTKVADAFFYMFISMTLTSHILGNVYFKEKVKIKEILVCTLLVIGLFCFAYPLDVHKLFGASMGVIGGLCWGISNATRKLYDGKMNRWLVIFFQMLAGSLIALLLAYLSHNLVVHNWTLYSSFILFLYALGNILLQYLLFVGLRNFDLNLSSVVLASQLIFVVLVGMLFLHEIPTIIELTGAAVVAGAIVLSKANI